MPPVKNVLAERILPVVGMLCLIALEANPRNRALLTLLYGRRAPHRRSLGWRRWRDLSQRDDGAGQVNVDGKAGKARGAVEREHLGPAFRHPGRGWPG